MKPILAAVLAFAFSLSPALAQSFTSKDVQNLMAVTDELEALSDKYPEFDIEMNTDDPTFLQKIVDENGNLKMFDYVMSQLPANSDVRKDVTATVKKNGFSSLDSFSSISDSILMAMMALELEKEDLSQLDMMTPEMIATLPPEMAEMIKTTKRMVEGAQKVSTQDRETLRPLKDQLQKKFEG